MKKLTVTMNPVEIRVFRLSTPKQKAGWTTIKALRGTRLHVDLYMEIQKGKPRDITLE